MPTKATSATTLVIAVIVALAGLGVGAYYATQPHGTSTQYITTGTTITAVTTVTAPAATVTATSTAPPTTLTTTVGGATVTATSTATAAQATVTATSVTTNTVTATGSVSSVTVGSATSDPAGIAFNPTNDEIYVALQGSASVAVINAATNALITTITLPTGDNPNALGYDSVNNYIYVANINSNCPSAQSACTVPVINCATNTLTTPIAVDDTTNSVAVNPTTNTVFLASNDADGNFILNVATNTVNILQNHTALPDNSQSLAVDSSKNLVFDGNSYGKRTQAAFGIIGPSATSTCQWHNTNTSYCFTKTVGIDGLSTGGAAIDGIAVNPTTGMIYLANYKDNLVNVISETTGQDIANITVASPYSLAVDTTLNLVYVASTSTNSLVIINGSSNTVVGSIAVGTSPMWVAVDTTTRAIIVSNSGSGSVTIVSGLLY